MRGQYLMVGGNNVGLQISVCIDGIDAVYHTPGDVFGKGLIDRDWDRLVVECEGGEVAKCVGTLLGVEADDGDVLVFVETRQWGLGSGAR